LFGKRVFLKQFRDIIGKEEQLDPIVRPIFEADGGFGELEGGVKLVFL
jgi:hypothetical protein